MARKPRIESPGALYHLYSRGNQKQDIFLSEPDFGIFTKRMSEYKEEYDFILYAYTLMKNHFHLLVEMRETSLSRIMQGLLQSYTQYFNLKYKKVGHLFQGRYKAILCQKDAYLLELIRYLHLNAVRAGIVASPNDYKWSSHHDYLKGESKLIDVDLGLSFFSRDKKIAIEKYKAFIDDGIGGEGEANFYAVVDQRFLGDEAFVEGVMERKEKAVEDTIVLQFDSIWPVIENVFGLKKVAIIGRSRHRNVLAARVAFVHLCREFANKKVGEIAGEIRRDPAMVTNLGKLGESSFKEEVKRAVLYLNSKNSSLTPND